MATISRRVIARTVAAKLLEHPKERSHWLRALAAYLVEQNRIEEIDLVVNDIAHELFVQEGHLLVDVESARPLTEGVRSELRKMLSDATRAKHIELAESTEAELLGGLIARTPDAVADLSIRTKLKQLASLA